ncbi:MAG: 30S ribosome-binding factor RbfA [Planctomycetota bacterium]
MSSRRTLKAAEAIREVVSMAILTDLQDPRVEDVTVTYVEVSPDMRTAKVHVSVMGDDAKQRRCLHGLQSSAGYLQSKVANRIDTRYTPTLRFELDMGVKNSIAIAKTLREVLDDSPSGETAETNDEHGATAESVGQEADNHPDNNGV